LISLTKKNQQINLISQFNHTIIETQKTITVKSVSSVTCTNQSP